MSVVKELNEKELESVKGGITYKGQEYNNWFNCKSFPCPNCGQPIHDYYSNRKSITNTMPKVYICNNCNNMWDNGRL